MKSNGEKNCLGRKSAWKHSSLRQQEYFHLVHTPSECQEKRGQKIYIFFYEILIAGIRESEGGRDGGIELTLSRIESETNV